MKRSFLVAQLGARMHYAVPNILHQAGMLERFVTDITAAKSWPRFLRMLPKIVLPTSARRLVGRVPRDIPARKITAFTSFGWEYARRQTRCNSSDSSSVYLWAGKRFCQLSLKSGLGNAQGIYTFNSAGLELLQEGQRRGLQTVMEQTIAPKRIERKLLDDERNRFPDWEETATKDEFVDAFIQREEAEWQVADLIVCGSEFVRDGIARCDGPVEKCIVVPYGVDVTSESGVGSQKPQTNNHPLRVLTVGALGLRKGAPYVLEAAKQLKGKMEFRMVGGIGVSAAAYSRLREHLELTGPVPRSEISSQFEWADVFLLPSLCEGSATVTYEALAYGLPVICTPNTGSVVRDGVDGFVVPVQNAAAIVEQLEKLADDEELYSLLSANARVHAEELTMAAYGRRLLATLDIPSPQPIK